MRNKTKPPLTIIALSIVAAAGLVALFLAAKSAFSTVAGREQAIAAALLIEAGIVVEALTLARSRNRIAGGGLVVSYLVSASYNFTQAHDARPGLAGWQLVALALGPLSALTFISLALGAELRVWGEGVAEGEREAAVYARDQERLARLRDERHRRKLELAAKSDDRSVTGQADDDRTDVRRWPDKAAFLSDPDRPDGLTTSQLAVMAGISARSARRWAKAARNGKGIE